MTKILKKIITPPLVLLVSILVAVYFSFTLPLYRIDNSSYQILGWIILFLGIALDVWSFVLFQQAKTTLIPQGKKKPTKLVTHGPYSYSRNVIYLGYVLILIGFAIIAQSVAAFIAPILMFVAMNIFVIPEEEKILVDEFGVEYETYRAKVGRWIGTRLR